MMTNRYCQAVGCLDAVESHVKYGQVDIDLAPISVSPTKLISPVPDPFRPAELCSPISVKIFCID